MGAETLRYASFISYRHMPRDRHWAVRVMRALETYRTPKPLRREAFPDRLRHLFRDEDEIPASSDHLIVICSPETPGSRWVRREIELFHEMGKGDRIIPLLIAGEPDDAFPPELRRPRIAQPKLDGTGEFAWEEVEPIAADVRPRKDERASKTENRAVLRLAAVLLGCRCDDLARRDAGRQRAALRHRLAAAAMVLFPVTSGGLRRWDANLRVKTEYCANYGERWAAPFCIGELDASVRARRTTNHRCRVQGGRVLELARVNGVGGLVNSQDTPYEDEPWTTGVALWRFVYRGGAFVVEPLLAFVAMEGPTGVQIRQAGYEFSDDHRQAIARFDRSFGVSERHDAAGSALNLSALGASGGRRQSRIGQHRLSFDALGRLLHRDFEPVGGGSTVTDALGAYCRGYEYDSSGVANQLRSLDAQAEALVEKSGIATERRDYDTRGDLINVEWRDADGRSRANEQRFARVVLTRGSVGNLERALCQGPTGGPVNRADRGFANLPQTNDAHGNEIGEDYSGTNGQQVLQKDVGSARLTWWYDERGNKVEAAYFGIDGQPVRRSDLGIARVTVPYDERGDQVEEANFGIDGAPTLNSGGFADRLTGYDAKDRIVLWAYHDTAGHPVLIDGIGARARYADSDMDQIDRITYLDERDRIIPLEVRVREVALGSVVERNGLVPGDRLLAYAGETLTCLQQLVAIRNQPGTQPRELIFRHGTVIASLQVRPGSFGVSLINICAETKPADALSASPL